MKNKVIVMLLVCITLCQSGCEGNFEPNIYGSLSTTNFPTTYEDTEALVMSAYMPFHILWSYNLSGTTQRQLYNPTGGVVKLFDATSDLMKPWTIGSWGAGWLEMSQANFANTIYWGRGPNDNAPTDYEKIRDVTRFTQIIGILEQSEFLTEEERNSLMGETRLLRGLLMYYLMHVYGPVPVIVDPAIASDLEAQQELERPSLDEMTQYITDDFEYAIANMSNDQPNGRYTKDYAMFSLMKHSLNEGKHMDGYYQKAIDLYGELKNSGYSLYQSDGEDAYANLFKQGNKFNSEIIMAVSVSENGNGQGPNGSFNPWSYYLAPPDAAPYDQNGNPTPFVYGKGWAQVYNISADFYDTFEEGDARANTILTSYTRENSEGELEVIDSDDLQDHWNGYIINKYPIEIEATWQPTDFPIARWADVLLMYAEAVARNTQSVPNGEALEAVNAVRERAGLEPLGGEALSSYNNFMDALIMERGHELFFEGHRKIDLIRFERYREYTLMYKGLEPTHQYLPLPNYAVEEAARYGYSLEQIFQRP